MLDPLTQLYETYAVISNPYWLANGKSFRKAYTPTEPIKVVWRQIDDAVAYADAGSTPYLTKQVVDNAYQLVFNTDIFTVDCQECNKRSADEKRSPISECFSPPPTGSGVTRFKIRWVTPTVPRTTPP